MSLLFCYGTSGVYKMQHKIYVYCRYIFFSICIYIYRNIYIYICIYIYTHIRKLRPVANHSSSVSQAALVKDPGEDTTRHDLKSLANQWQQKCDKNCHDPQSSQPQKVVGFSRQLQRLHQWPASRNILTPVKKPF